MPINSFIFNLKKSDKFKFLMSDSKYSLFLDGEIYNDFELKDKYNIQTEDDAELIFFLLKKMGLDFVNSLNGKFFIIIYNKMNNEYVFIKDRLGEIPVFIYKTDSNFILASYIKDIVNEAGKLEYTKPNSILETIYKNIKIFPPATIATRKSNSQTSFQKYWNPVSGASIDDFDTAVDKIRSLLTDAINIRSGKSKTAFLCGGLDSAIVCGFGKPQDEVFSFDNDYRKEISDVYYARSQAEHLGVDIKFIRPEKEDFHKNLESTVCQCDIPIVATSHVVHYMMSQRIHQSNKNYKAVMYGCGGDELFGYLRTSIIGYEIELYDNKCFEYYSLLLDRYYGDHVARFLKMYSLNPEWFSKYLNAPRDKVLLNCQLAALDGILLNELIMEEKMCRMFGLTTRNPYCDYRVVEAAFSYPKHFDIQKGEVKKVLRKAAENVLSKEVYNRKHKVGHCLPVDEWLKYTKKYSGGNEYIRLCTDILKRNFCRG